MIIKSKKGSENLKNFLVFFAPNKKGSENQGVSGLFLPKTKKGIVGKALTFITCSLLILILFFGFFFGLKAHFSKDVEIQSIKAQDYRTQQEMLSLFTTDTIKDLLEDKTLKFKEALRNVYGEKVQCKLTIDGEEKSVGCEKIKGFSSKLELTIPKQFEENTILIFEVAHEID
ncbi:hypothetical protein HY837_00430 [archaeon]|nr:hypothetical protein [archaeon]